MLVRMLFSIITVTYNAAEYLEATLLSTLNQNFKNFEHIVLDGGSQDKTLEIAKRFGHIKIFEGKDEGIADAMNKGALIAQGDYLLYLHGDDLLSSKGVLKMLEIAIKQHPGIQWLYGRSKIIDQNSLLLRETPYESFSSKRLRKYNFLTHPSVCISKDFFHQIGGFDVGLRYAMDYDLWLRASKFSTPLALSSTLSSFREHGKSLSTSHPLNTAKEAYLVRNRYTEGVLERFRSYRTWKKRKKRLKLLPFYNSDASS